MTADIKDLREAIRSVITQTIHFHRNSKKDFVLMNNTVASDEEVNRFLFSIPYLDRPLCYHLMSDGIIANLKTNLWVTENWLREFHARVEYWATSISWLEGELILIHFPGFMGRALVDDARLKLPRLLFEARSS
jgi:hypothetical protein